MIVHQSKMDMALMSVLTSVGITSMSLHMQRLEMMETIATWMDVLQFVKLRLDGTDQLQ